MIKLCQENMVLDDRIWAEDLESLGKDAMEELLKERRCTEVEEWRDTVVAECGVTQMAAPRPKEDGGRYERL